MRSLLENESTNSRRRRVRAWYAAPVLETGLKRIAGMGVLVGAALQAGCSSSPEVNGGDTPNGPGQRADGGARGDGGTGFTPPGIGDEDIIDDELPGDEDDHSSEGDAGSVVDPCQLAGCGPGQRCVEQDGGMGCVDLSCDELDCGLEAQCEAHERGGHVCVDTSCSADVDCGVDQFCSQAGVCEADICESGARACDGDELFECSSNGSANEAQYTCGGGAHFESECVSLAAGDAACSCEDDWDCPAHTVCEVNVCRGTGVAPTCTLPPTSFEDTEPSVEIHWGGNARGDDEARDGSAERTLAPWANSSHVWATPLVVNLDDDNGDGQVNELDFPEIIFTSYTPRQINDSGVLRAIHGGGPNRGKDYFARCDADLLWTTDNPTDAACPLGDANARAPAAVADLDGDQIPEIVYVTLARGFRVLNHRGEVLIDLGDEVAYNDPSGTSGEDQDRVPNPSIVNLDYAGLPEIVFGATVYVLDIDDTGKLFASHRLDGSETQGTNDSTGPMSCPADVHPSPGQELLAGGTLYRLPDTLPTCDAPPCAGQMEVVWSSEEVSEGFCAIADVWGADASQPPGPANPPDGAPEGVLIADGDLVILNLETGELIERRDLGGGRRGGAPNVDDFDGDGYMEIASALENFYVVVDLQEPTDIAGNCPAWPEVLPRETQPGQADNPNIVDEGRIRNPGGAGAMSLPSGAIQAGSCESDSDCNEGAVCNAQAGTCVCLHNGWTRDSDDNSSRATSSSVFDFNGDGAAEVLYNDECNFRIYDGVGGSVLFSEVSRSRTFTENPVVADVDNDGNAEVVTVLNTEENDRCDDDPEVNGTRIPQGPNGIRVWGDLRDTWVSARRIWNQQSYHVTNITEGGVVPKHAPESWGEFNGRMYNTYRSQPRSYGVAPDLTIGAISVFSPGVACGELGDGLEIVFEVKNAGDLRVGPGVEVAIYGSWGDQEEELQGEDGPLKVVLDASIEPGRSVLRSATFSYENQPGRDSLPDSVRVVADSGGEEGSSFGAERECNEDNNDLTRDVEAGEQRPDLAIALGEANVDCSDRVAEVEVTVKNDGTAVARDVRVRIFAGDPARGGSPLHTFTLEEPLAPSEEVTMTVEVPNFPSNRVITLWGWVDPDNRIDECNESDNSDPADNPISCSSLQPR